MKHIIQENFTDNEIVITGERAPDFLHYFQINTHEPTDFDCKDMREIRYRFKYEGIPNSNWLVFTKIGFQKFIII